MTELCSTTVAINTVASRPPTSGRIKEILRSLSSYLQQVVLI